MADSYQRSAEYEQEYNPGDVVDDGGIDNCHSASSEGVMANQNPFNVASEAITSKKAQQQQERELRQEASAEEMPVGGKKSTGPQSSHPSRNNGQQQAAKTSQPGQSPSQPGKKTSDH
jgi:hypothetical protein